MNITVQLPSILELIPSAIDDLLKRIGSAVELSKEDSFQIRLILEEAIANGVCHGNNYDTGFKVDISITVENDLVKMSIKDEGKGFNHQNILDPIKKENLFKPIGRGIYLIKKIADDVKFNDPGNEIIITKRIGKNIKEKPK